VSGSGVKWRSRLAGVVVAAWLALGALGAQSAIATGPGYFSPTGSMSVGRASSAMAPLPDGRVLVVGGTNFDGGTSATELSSAEIFDPATNSFSSAGIGSMTVPRVGAVAAALPDGRVLVAGGYDHDGILSSAEVFDPATNSFSSAGIGSMSVPRTGAVAAPLPDGRVLVAGGNFNPDRLYPCPLSSAEVFDPTTDSFNSAGIGSMFFEREDAAAAPLGDGSVLVVGGAVGDLHCGTVDLTNTFDLSAEAFDPSTQSFSSSGIGLTSVPRYGAAAASLPDARVLVAGSDRSYPSNASAEIFTSCSQTPARCVPATCHGKAATITGSDGPDQISGTRGADVIAGLGGSDKLRGLAGNDLICGGDDNDTLKGGKGKDKLYGEAGRDTLRGGPGRDKLRGGAGRDRQVQ
jgi:Ca2+-binding RTX toxin-like protein